ncbi:MAG: 1-deoxy-D-xylulose-5-phosphate synthase [Elusimicrobiota bacterium]
MSILEKISRPQDMRLLRKELLPKLAEEIRQEIIQTVAKNGGHLGASLGVVELTIALHYVLNAPEDKIVWDVGHQSYAHKLLTGRRERFSTLRQYGGLSGFPRREESPYDAFGVGHSSTSISAALGLAVARDYKSENHKVVAVIGDGGMTGGLAFEGLINAGHLGSNLLVILNDNEMFISHRVGAVAGYLTKLLTAGLIKRLENRVETFLKRIHFLGMGLMRVAKRFRVLLFPGMLFEEMGFSYFGPVNGHDLPGLTDVLRKIVELKGPVLLHVVTKKGKGYQPSEEKPADFHGVGPFNIITGQPAVNGKVPTYTKVFSDTLLRLAEKNEKIVAITAAMSEGTGLDKFARQYPKRFFDVGIAEGHALTFAAGLAASGLQPVCAIYSTFLQRAYDQIIHDIALQKLPVILAIDRAGIVGEDGATHQGTFDVNYLRVVPNLTIMSPADENELQHMLHTALTLKGPVALRYPRGAGLGVKLDQELKLLPLKADLLASGSDLALVAVGSMVSVCREVVKRLENEGVHCSLVNARLIKPLDKELLEKVAEKNSLIITVEENSVAGGFGSAVKEVLEGSSAKIIGLSLPDAFIEHGDISILRDKYGLTSEKIYQSVKKILKLCPRPGRSV